MSHRTAFIVLMPTVATYQAYTLVHNSIKRRRGRDDG